MEPQDERHQDIGEPREQTLSVGDLARAAGVSVRTLQYYDRQELLEAGLNASGRRRYGREDVLKLQQILFLKSFGFSLDDIKERLIGGGDPEGLSQLFFRQRRLLVEEIERLQESVSTLDEMIPEVQRHGEVSLERLMVLIKLRRQEFPYTSVLDYLSDSQLHVLTAAGQTQSGAPQAIEELTAELVRLYRQGADPTSRTGQDFAARWWHMVEKVTGSDPDLMAALSSAGADAAEWPHESRELVAAVRSFLTSAMHAYHLTHPTTGVDTLLGEAKAAESRAKEGRR